MLTSVENVHYINILTIRHLGKWTLLLVENVEVKLTHTHIYMPISASKGTESR